MNDTRFSPDDPKLTAYALGELAGDERAAMDAMLRQSPALRRAVEEIRATAAQMEAALAAESAGAAANGINAANAGTPAGASLPRIRRRRRVATRREIAPAKEAGSGERYSFPSAGVPKKRIRFPQLYYVIAGAAAAGFAVFVALRNEPAAVSPAGPILAELIPIAEQAEKVKRDRGRAGNREIAAAPPATAETQTALATPTTTPTPAPPLPGANNFVDAELPLVAQVRRDVETIATAAVEAGEAPPLLLSATPAILATAATSGTSESASTENVSSAVSGESAAGATLTTPAPAPAPTVMPLIAAGAPPAFSGPAASVLPIVSWALGSAAPAENTPVLATTPGSGETIKMAAFMVSADRAHGFATSGKSSTGAPGPRVWGERDYLPHAPPDAKFGRNAEEIAQERENAFVRVASEPRSAFSLAVDTASYPAIRTAIGRGALPAREAVRIEEMLNYFPYRYATPAPEDDRPLAATLEVAAAPWAPAHRLVRIGLKARETPAVARGAANLVFLVDVSSSMDQPNKLPLVKQALRALVGQLRPDDRVAIVTYAGNSGLALPLTPVARGREILNALEALAPGRAHHGAAGIQLAYEVAEAHFAREGINRVILCTDGDFDVGLTSERELMRFVGEKAARGVFLSALGFGMGKYRDATLEKLADAGRGSHGYLDTRREAEKLLGEQVNGEPATVARDAKIEVTFDPARVAAYRLIGYENRWLSREEFNDDSVDAGEIGAGQAVTALYEIVPTATAVTAGAAAKSGVSESQEGRAGGELLTVKVRYKNPDSVFGFAKTMEFRLRDAATPFAEASADFRFAAAVAQFGMMLRTSPHRGAATIGDVTAWAASAAANPADDPGGYRGEFIDLVRRTQELLSP